MKSIRYIVVVLLMGSYDLYAPEAFEPANIFEEGGSGILVGDKVVDRFEFTDAQLEAIRKGDMPLDEQASLLRNLQENPELNLKDVTLIKDTDGGVIIGDKVVRTDTLSSEQIAGLREGRMPLDEQLDILQKYNSGSMDYQEKVVTDVVDPLGQTSDAPFDPRDFQAAVDVDIAAVDKMADDQKSSSELSAQNAEKMLEGASRLEDDLAEVDQHMAELQDQTWLEKIKSALGKAKNAIKNFVKKMIGSGKVDQSIREVSQTNVRLESFAGSDPSLEALFSDGDVSEVPNQIAESLEFLDQDVSTSRHDSSVSPDDVEAAIADREAAAVVVDEYVQAAQNAVTAISKTAEQSNPDYGAHVRQELTQQTVALKKELADSLVRNIKDANSPKEIANRTKRLKELQSKDLATLTPQERSELVVAERDDMRFKTATEALEGVQKISQMTPEQKAAVQTFGDKVITSDAFVANFGEDAALKIGIELTGSEGGRAESAHVGHYSNMTDPGNFYRQLTMFYAGGKLVDAVVASQNNFTPLTRDQITQVGQAFVDYANKSIGQGTPFGKLPRQVQEIYIKSIGGTSPDAGVANVLEPLVARAETHGLMKDALSGKSIAPLSDGVKADLNSATSAYRDALMQ